MHFIKIHKWCIFEKILWWKMELANSGRRKGKGPRSRCGFQICGCWRQCSNYQVDSRLKLHISNYSSLSSFYVLTYDEILGKCTPSSNLWTKLWKGQERRWRISRVRIKSDLSRLVIFNRNYLRIYIGKKLNPISCSNLKKSKISN